MSLFKDYMSRKELAKMCNVSIQQTYKWTLPRADYLDANRHLWKKTTIDKWLTDVITHKIKKVQDKYS